MAVVVAVVRTGSFTKAAAALGMTQSGTSKLLARLEDRLGVQLLRRTTRAMQLTEIGKLYYERACLVLAEIEGLERDVEGHNRDPHGRIRMTAPTGLGEHLLVPMVVAFQQRYPEVTVEVDLTDRVVDLGAEEFDLAIRLTDRPPESCVAHKLAPEVRLLCASPEYLYKHGTPDQTTDLAAHRCVSFTTPNGPDQWYLRREIDGPVKAFTFPGTLLFNNIVAVRQAVVAGAGIGDFPAYIVEHQLATGQLVPLLAPYVPSRRNIYAIYAASRLIPAKTHAFLKILEMNFKLPRGAASDGDPRQLALG
jgi:DNA-binding transcriptional LysR family regulator